MLGSFKTTPAVRACGPPPSALLRPPVRRVHERRLKGDVRKSRLSRAAATQDVAPPTPVNAPEAPVVAGDARPSVSLLGVGLMGYKMACRLQDLGFPVTAWNRSEQSSARLTEVGCVVATSALQAVQSSDVVVLVLSDAAAIAETLLSPEVRQSLRGKTIVQMGTIGPQESREICAEVESAGGEYLEAPVLGSQPEASKGTLLIMVGARQDPSQSRSWPVLLAFGQAPTHIGDVGTAAATKLALNQLIASLTIGFSTSLGLLQRNDVDVDKFMSILRPSALYAPTFDKKLQRMLDREYSNPNFPTKHLLKDVKLFQREAVLSGLDTSLLVGLEKVIQSTVDRGLDFTDYSAVHDAVIEPDSNNQP